MNDRFAGALRHHPRIPRPSAFPDGGSRYGVFERTVGQLGERGRRLLDRLLEVDGGRPFRMRGDDLVHTDYTPDNVLFDAAGNVSGVIDWNQGAARGDRHYALLPMHWDNSGIEAQLAHLTPATRRSYEAHWMIQQVHESIVKGFSPERIGADAARAEAVLS